MRIRTIVLSVPGTFRTRAQREAGTGAQLPTASAS
jgi:hypothetical protein